MKLAALTLFSIAAFAQQAQVTQHMILVEPTGTDLNVSEAIIVSNGRKLQIAIPKDAEVAGTRGGTAVKTAKPGVYDVTVEGQPNTESRFDISWTMPFIVPDELAGTILHTDGTVRFVFPKGVKVTGKNLESNGAEPTTQASIYTLKGNSYKITIDGAGSLRAQRPPAGEEEEQGPPIQQILPRIYDNKYVIVGLILGILAIGFYLNYRGSVKH